MCEDVGPQSARGLSGERTLSAGGVPQEPKNTGGQEGLQQRGTTRSGLLSTVGFSSGDGKEGFWVQTVIQFAWDPGLSQEVGL